MRTVISNHDTENELDLVLHSGTGSLSTDQEFGFHFAMKIGPRDAQAIRAYLDEVYPDDPSQLQTLTCHKCGKLADASRRAIVEGEEHEFVCAKCDPEGAKNRRDPERRVATVDTVKAILRGTWGFDQEETNQAVYLFPYTILAAAAQGMTAEEVARDAALRYHKHKAGMEVETSREVNRQVKSAVCEMVGADLAAKSVETIKTRGPAKITVEANPDGTAEVTVEEEFTYDVERDESGKVVCVTPTTQG